MQNCPECNAEVTTGSRWCGLCHTNVLNKEIGRLASPGKRLGAYFLDLLVPIVALILSLFVASAGAATETGGEPGSAASSPPFCLSRTSSGRSFSLREGQLQAKISSACESLKKTAGPRAFLRCSSEN